MSDILPSIREFLENLNFDFEVWACEPEFSDTITFCKHYGASIERSVNTIVVKTKTGETKYAVCLVVANSRLDVNNVVRKKLGVRKASFASPDETRAITGMEIGGVTPFALPAELPLWIDTEVMNGSYVILGGGNRESKLKITPTIFRIMANSEIVEGLAKPQHPQ